jgi:uncharacterized protein YecT (DUF1311 family)
VLKHVLARNRNWIPTDITEVLTVVDGDELVRLKTAQRLWIQFLDANCDAERELYSGRSAAPVVKLACQEEMTGHRTEEMNVIYGWRLEKWGK